MNIRFEPNPQLAPDTVNVTVEAAKLNAEALQVLQLLEENQNASSGLTRLPLLVDDKTIMVASQDLIAMEVYQNYTQEATYLVKGQLNKMLERLDGRDFVQVSKSALLNINHLHTLEMGFSGNMVALMTHKIKLGVSRKYLPALKQALGMGGI